jgi:hypothetical protein
MTFSKRKADDGDPDWEGAQAVKLLKPTPGSEMAELQEDRGNYGTIASQRPTRERKRPERYSDICHQSVSKRKKATSSKAAKSPKKPSPRTSSAAKKRASQPIPAELQVVKDIVANNADKSPELPDKMSNIVRLKLPPNGSTPATPKLQSFHQPNDESDSELSSPPASLPSGPVCRACQVS